VSGLVDRVLGLSGVLVYLIVGLVVFAEDAIFVGFVVPGETAAVLGGVIASRGGASLVIMVVLVVAAAIIGDTVGYEVGRHLGTRILDARFLAKRRHRIEKAQDFLRRRGGAAVFLGRFVAFFRAVMPALAARPACPTPGLWCSTPPGASCGESGSSCSATWPATPTSRWRKRWAAPLPWLSSPSCLWAY